MWKALLHEPSHSLNQCELTYLPSRAIDIEKARAQHRAYAETLREYGVDVTVLDGNRDLPDSVFVEDTALVLDEIAILTPMGVASRRAESELMAEELARQRRVCRIKAPAKLEGGDILTVGRRLFVGQGTRTDRAGVEALRSIVDSFGYEVIPVVIPGCLHLKTGCTALDERTLLINPEWVDAEPFEAFRKIAVDPEEPFAANILVLPASPDGSPGTICMAAGFDRTRVRLEAAGFRVVTVDISEFLKAEAGLTCMSLIFRDVAEDP